SAPGALSLNATARPPGGFPLVSGPRPAEAPGRGVVAALAGKGSGAPIVGMALVVPAGSEAASPLDACCAPKGRLDPPGRPRAPSCRGGQAAGARELAGLRGRYRCGVLSQQPERCSRANVKPLVDARTLLGAARMTMGLRAKLRAMRPELMRLRACLAGLRARCGEMRACVWTLRAGLVELRAMVERPGAPACGREGRGSAASAARVGDERREGQ